MRPALWAPLPVTPTVVLAPRGVLVLLTGLEARDDGIVGMESVGMMSWN